MHAFKFTSLLALVLCCAGAAAGDRKFCGSGWTENLVPDEIGGCKMAEACKVHDICYGKCDPGGSKYGSDYCKKSEFSLARIKAKMQCDKTFAADIKAANPGNGACSAIAAIYMKGVQIGGQGPFNGRPMSPQAVLDLATTSKSSDEAANKAGALFRLAGQGKVDLSTATAVDQALTIQKLDPASKEPKGELLLKKGLTKDQVQSLGKSAGL